MSEPLYSVRMRASKDGLHVSGAELIVGPSGVGRAALELAGRAMHHERGRPDSVNISVDSLAGKRIINLSPLPVTSRQARSLEEAHGLAASELVKAGVSEFAARMAMNAITSGASSDGANMCGAMIVDAATGERLETDRRCGIRARAVDYEEGFLSGFAETLKMHGLDNSHLKEALALATKVAGAPGTVAELCISDDPSYVTGYVASQRLGYVRITPLKEQGNPMGGRAFFVDGASFDPDAYMAYMRETPVLIKGEIEFA